MSQYLIQTSKHASCIVKEDAQKQFTNKTCDKESNLLVLNRKTITFGGLCVKWQTQTQPVCVYGTLAVLEAEINQSNGLNNLPDALQKYNNL